MRLSKFIVIPLLIISFLLFSSVTANSEDSSIEKRLKALEERNRTLEKNYQDLQEKYEDLQKRIETEAVVQEKPKSSEEQVTEVQELKEEVKSVKEEVKRLLPGTDRFLITGWGAASYINRQSEGAGVEGQDSTFNVVFNPIFLFRLLPNLLFEAEVEFELEDDETEVGLEYAQIDYLFSRYSTAVLGKFLTPFGVFPLKIHPAWINKLTNRPLMYRSGFLPFTNVGAQLTGAYAPPNDSFRLTYALALVNGGVLEIEGEENEEGIIEKVEDIEIISDSVDITDNVGFIGRIGVIPFQNSQYLNGLEIGASWLVEKVKLAEDDLEFGPGLMGLDNSRNHFTFGIDWDYFYKGLELRGEFAQSHLSLPEEISNLEKQWGTYVQGSYRPTTLGIKYLKDTEAVVRYGQRGGDNEEFKRKELGLGLDYWFTSSFVAKAAYFFVFGQEENISNNAFMLQAAYGF